MTINLPRTRREGMRWIILLTLNNNRPEPASEWLIGETIRGVIKDATDREVRKELDYLRDRELISIKADPDDMWHADITRHGVDVVEYSVDCEAGIARPPNKRRL